MFLISILYQCDLIHYLPAPLFLSLQSGYQQILSLLSLRLLYTRTMSQTVNHISVPAVLYVVPIAPDSTVYYPVVIQYHPYIHATAAATATTTAKGLSGSQQPNSTLKKPESPWNKLLEKEKRCSLWNTLISKEKTGVEKAGEKKSLHDTGHCSSTTRTVICRGCHPSYCCYTNCPDCRC